MAQATRQAVFATAGSDGTWALRARLTKTIMQENIGTSADSKAGRSPTVQSG